MWSHDVKEYEANVVLVLTTIVLLFSILMAFSEENRLFTVSLKMQL